MATCLAINTLRDTSVDNFERFRRQQRRVCEDGGYYLKHHVNNVITFYYKYGEHDFCCTDRVAFLES